jgi:hypothetical protein
MIKIKTTKVIEVQDWDDLVKKTYKKPYSFQQQNGCQARGNYYLTVPSKDADENDSDMHDSIPEEINGEIMGVKFAAWLARDPKQPLNGSEKCKKQWGIDLFWERNFYPDIEVVANDLFKKGLIKKGEYVINIDW